MRHTRTDTGRSIGPVLTCTRRDSPFHRFLSVSAQRASRVACDLDGETVSTASWLKTGRVVSVPLPWLSPPVLVYGCVPGWWGDFPQQPEWPPSAALSLSCTYGIFREISTTVQTDFF